MPSISKIRTTVRYYARRLLWQLLKQWRETLTVKTRQGLLTVFSADKSIGKYLFCRGEYELEWIEQVITFLRDQGRLPAPGTVLDIGANMGVTSIGMLHTGLMKAAIAIEPDPANFKLLQQNVRQNKLEARFVCLNSAASDQNGSLLFELSERNFGDHRVRIRDASDQPLAERHSESKRKVIEVAAARLDDLMAQVPAERVQELSLVWIDVQGHEGHLFRGGEKLFSRDIPVHSELWPYGLRRAGMELDGFCTLAARFWSRYWTLQNGALVEFPIVKLRELYQQLESEGKFSNVVFMK